MLEGLAIGDIENMIDHLPLELTFIDADDAIVYYSRGDGRIFSRTPDLITMKVQDCHSSRSVHVVQQILDDFRAGKRDVAESWRNRNGRTIYIRYVAVRDKNRGYQGALEVIQDITDIQKLRGEKSLLD